MRDQEFIRGKVPMTKREVRAVSLERLEIRDGEVLYDIGAGTGSVAIEAALASPGCRVYAFEQKEEACRLIRQNQEKFKVPNVTLIPGCAPESLEGLPAPDKVFIGGSGGKMAEILEYVARQNPAVRIVINIIALETLAEVTRYLEQQGLEAETVCIQVSRARKAGAYHLMEAMNPVYVVTLDQAEADAGGREEARNNGTTQNRDGLA